MRDGLSLLGLGLEPAQAALLDRFRRLLLEENLAHNLTRLESDCDFAIRHVVDSLTCLLTGVLDTGGRLVDIGSGAGFPGIPLKIARPALDVTLLDSSHKRTAFLSRAVVSLGLEGCRVLTERAEVLGRAPGHRAAYGLAVARAVAAMAVDLEYAVPLLTLGGRFVAMKGPKALTELGAAERAAGELGAELEQATELTLPLTGDRRLLAVFVKTAPTPDSYPRRPGVPAKRPLGTAPSHGRGWATGEETLQSRP